MKYLITLILIAIIGLFLYHCYQVYFTRYLQKSPEDRSDNKIVDLSDLMNFYLCLSLSLVLVMITVDNVSAFKKRTSICMGDNIEIKSFEHQYQICENQHESLIFSDAEASLENIFNNNQKYFTSIVAATAIGADLYDQMQFSLSDINDLEKRKEIEVLLQIYNNMYIDKQVEVDFNHE